MTNEKQVAPWSSGAAPVAVVMISLNEGHNIESVLENLKGWAQEVFLVDSFSQDETVDVALRYGVHVVQRRFRDFGDQWNFALQKLPINAPWTLKLDPDERLTDEIKHGIIKATCDAKAGAFWISIRLMFMGSMLPIRLRLLRLWKTGRATMSKVAVNEHIKVECDIAEIKGDIEHQDSPNLDHWLEKQNRYTTAEAVIMFNRSALADTPRFFGGVLQRRMWLKKNFYKVPFRYLLLFFYHWLWQGAWRVGWPGYAWARLRTDVMRLKEYKAREMRLTGRLPVKRVYGPGKPDPRVPQFD